jgi:hypothetical protein
MAPRIPSFMNLLADIGRLEKRWVAIPAEIDLVRTLSV